MQMRTQFLRVQNFTIADVEHILQQTVNIMIVYSKNEWFTTAVPPLIESSELVAVSTLKETSSSGRD